jgi:ATP-dependent helicase HrpA
VSDEELAAATPDARDALPWNRAAFETLRDRVNAGLPDPLFGIVATTAAVLAAAREVDVLIARSSSLQLMAPLADAREQLNTLVHDGFIGRTGLARLPRLIVYLRGISHRVERLADNLGRDRAWMLEVQQAVELYAAAGGTLPLAVDPEPRIREARWMLEELRLSLFAQPLGAQGPISVQRIRKSLNSSL